LYRVKIFLFHTVLKNGITLSNVTFLLSYRFEVIGQIRKIANGFSLTVSKMERTA